MRKQRLPLLIKNNHAKVLKQLSFHRLIIREMVYELLPQYSIYHLRTACNYLNFHLVSYNTFYIYCLITIKGLNYYQVCKVLGIGCTANVKKLYKIALKKAYDDSEDTEEWFDY